MSKLTGILGKRKVEWSRPPRGPEGSSEVTVGGKTYVVTWRKDPEGLWVEFPHATFGFDIFGERDDAAGGMVYQINERGTARLHSGVRVRSAGEAVTTAAAAGKKKSIRVRAQMPGKIVRVLVQAGAEVVKDQPLLVMEAMKMENEIRASAAGKVETVKVIEGQAVESGADLILMG